MAKKTKKKKKNSNKKQQQPNYLAQALDIALTIAVVAGLFYTGYRVVTGGVKIDQGFGSGSGEVTAPEATTEAQPEFQSIEVAHSEVHEGPLVLVNDYNAFEGTESDLVSLYNVKMEKESHSFSVPNDALQVKPEMADALIAMLDDEDAARHDLAVISDLIRYLHGWYRAHVSLRQLQPIVPTGRISFAPIA